MEFYNKKIRLIIITKAKETLKLFNLFLSFIFRDIKPPIKKNKPAHIVNTTP